MSYCVDVIADSSGKPSHNDVRLAARDQAEGYARDLAARWTSVRSWEVVQSDDPVNYKYIGGQLVHMKGVENVE